MGRSAADDNGGAGGAVGRGGAVPAGDGGPQHAADHGGLAPARRLRALSAVSIPLIIFTLSLLNSLNVFLKNIFSDHGFQCGNVNRLINYRTTVVRLSIVSY